MLDESPVGELGRSVGLADIARGEEWLDGRGDCAGEDGRGEACSAAGLPTFRGVGRCKPRVGTGLVDEYSTSCNKDCRKLGPDGSGNTRRGVGEGLAERRARLEEDLGLLGPGAAERLVLLLFTTVGVDSFGLSVGEDVLDFLFLRREELGSAEAARAWSKASQAKASSESWASGAGKVVLLRLMGSRELPLLDSVGSVSRKRFPAPCSSATRIRRTKAS